MLNHYVMAGDSSLVPDLIKILNDSILYYVMQKSQKMLKN